jgi:2-polyprenyl-6-hydroxyphenyl methylase/3-demethylubiquinone-9 3-methyltransferase
MQNYYSQKLSANRLQRCYEIAPARVRQYLNAEIEFVLERIKSEDRVLELGCGYGRLLKKILGKAKTVVGIDTSQESIELAKEYLGDGNSCRFLEMDAADLSFRNGEFDLVFCIQNGISAFHVDPHRLFREAIRVTRKGGRVLFSSYSEKFWQHRLHWFRLQAEQGLVGEIDERATGNGVIVCKDGFTATTVSARAFLSLAGAFPVAAKIYEVDDSSLFCEMKV